MAEIPAEENISKPEFDSLITNIVTCLVEDMMRDPRTMTFTFTSQAQVAKFYFFSQCTHEYMLSGHKVIDMNKLLDPQVQDLFIIYYGIRRNSNKATKNLPSLLPQGTRPSVLQRTKTGIKLTPL